MSMALLRVSSRHAPYLERELNRLFSGFYDKALLQHCDVAIPEINRIRDYLPPIWRAIEGILSEPAVDNGVLRRALRYMSQPDENGCTRWTGATSNGTPVVSVDGKTRSVRVVLWNDRYPPGAPEYLGWAAKTRLRNIGCALASACVTLGHWYKPAGGEPGGYDHLDTSTLKEPPDATLRRIWGQTQPSGICVQWLGACAGVTPVFSYGGKTTIVRRVLWDITYPERPLQPNEKLQNEGCALKAGCLQITHWQVAGAPVDRDQAWAALQNMPTPDFRGKPCQNGAHWIRDDADYCSPCRYDAAHRRAKTRRVGFELGRAIKRRIRESKEKELYPYDDGGFLESVMRDAAERQIASDAVVDTDRSTDRHNRRDQRAHSPLGNSSVSEANPTI